MDTTREFIIWGIITAIFAILAIVAYKYISNVARFEKRKSEIALGFSMCVLAVSSLIFMSVLFSRLDLHSFGENLFDELQIYENDNIEDSGKVHFPPFVKAFSKFLAISTLLMIRMVVLLVPCAVSIMIIILTVIIILKIRETKKIDTEKGNRKHLFEYKNEVLVKLNK